MQAVDGPYQELLRALRYGEIDCVINTPEGGRATLQDGFQIRRAATERRIPCFTSIDTARAAVDALLAGSQAFEVHPIGEYRQG